MFTILPACQVAQNEVRISYCHGGVALQQVVSCVSLLPEPRQGTNYISGNGRNDQAVTLIITIAIIKNTSCRRNYILETCQWMISVIGKFCSEIF